MPKGEKSLIVNVTPEQMFDVVTDYTKYPQFPTDVLEARIEKTEGNVQLVTFAAKVVKRIEYTLRLVHDRPRSVSWTLVKGEMMKSNNGGWRFEPLADGRTQVTYHCELGLGALVPNAVSQKLVAIQMPSMLEAFKRRAESLHRK